MKTNFPPVRLAAAALFAGAIHAQTVMARPLAARNTLLVDFAAQMAFFTTMPVAVPVIAVRCLFTNQPYVIDLPAGATLGWAAFETFKILF